MPSGMSKMPQTVHDIRKSRKGGYNRPEKEWQERDPLCVSAPPILGRQELQVGIEEAVSRDLGLIYRLCTNNDLSVWNIRQITQGCGVYHNKEISKST